MRRVRVAGIVAALLLSGALPTLWRASAPVVRITNESGLAVSIRLETDIAATYPALTLAPEARSEIRATGQDQGIRVIATRADGRVLASEQTYVTAGVDVQATIRPKTIEIRYDLDD
ncbi:hypothetical protein [Nevskia sp.]|uniref:hypothetical protein n=1 Tax=Nevskia sp. TaxID=1929292 RepID=UPI0025F6A1F1|nr:hypothetical protein [Nevskia sp.]